MDIGKQCIQISKDFESRVADRMIKKGYSDYKHKYFYVLKEMLDKDYPVTNTTISIELSETQQCTGKKLKDLMEFGYIRKSVIKDDKRSSEIELTNKGFNFYQDILECIGAASEEYNQDHLKKLSWAVTDFIFAINNPL